MISRLLVINIFIVLFVGVVYSTPCWEKNPPAHPPCDSHPAPRGEHHCREKDHSKEEKHHKKCKDEKKKKGKKHGKKGDHGDKDVSIDIDITINFCGEVFTKSKYVDNTSERDIYLSWMEKCTQEEIEYINIVADYLEVEESLTEEIINYESFQKNIYKVYEVLKSSNIYSTQTDLHSQTNVFKKVKTQVVEAMSCLSEKSELYIALDYCVHKDITVMPIIVGLCRSVAMSQETYFSHSSTRSISENDHTKEEKHDKKEWKECKCKDHSKEEKHDKKECKDNSKEKKHDKEKHDKKGKECKDNSDEKKHDKKKRDHSEEEKHDKKCKDQEKKKDKKKHEKNSGSSHENTSVDIDINVNVNFYSEVFTECQYVDNSEGDIYVKWMDKCTKEQLEYVDVLVKYLQIRESLSSEIIDYELFQKDIFSVYEVFQRSHIYSAETDLYSQKKVFEQVKTQVVQAMTGLSEQSALYQALNYCVEGEVTMMPLVVGLCRSVVMSQETYFSQSSTSYSSTTSRSSGSCHS